jgi:KH domain
VPANAISRVIGRGGCNINAIRDISTAQVEIDRSRDATTERIITIKLVGCLFCLYCSIFLLTVMKLSV